MWRSPSGSIKDIAEEAAVSASKFFLCLLLLYICNSVFIVLLCTIFLFYIYLCIVLCCISPRAALDCIYREFYCAVCEMSVFLALYLYL